MLKGMEIGSKRDNTVNRGISDNAARKLLTYAFGAEIIERIAVPSLKRQLQQGMLAQTGIRP